MQETLAFILCYIINESRLKGGLGLVCQKALSAFATRSVPYLPFI